MNRRITVGSATDTFSLIWFLGGASKSLVVAQDRVGWIALQGCELRKLLARSVQIPHSRLLANKAASEKLSTQTSSIAKRIPEVLLTLVLGPLAGKHFERCRDAAQVAASSRSIACSHVFFSGRISNSRVDGALCLDHAPVCSHKHFYARCDYANVHMQKHSCENVRSCIAEILPHLFTDFHIRIWTSMAFTLYELFLSQDQARADGAAPFPLSRAFKVG